MLTAWILSLILALQPEAPWSDTYPATASAIDQAVQEHAPLFDGADDREKTAALLVSLAWFESTFKPNAVGKGGVRGLYQVAAHGDLSDPLRASRVALDLLQESFRLCRDRAVSERLAIYAAGGTSCKQPSEAALQKSRGRVAKALWLVKKFPPPKVARDAGASP